MKVSDPIGPDNDLFIKAVNDYAGLTIIGWGTKGNYLGRDHEVFPLLTRPHYLQVTKDGFPGHPLFLKKALRPKICFTVDFLEKAI